MLTLNWLKNEDHVVYGTDEELIPLLAKRLVIPDLGKKIEHFRCAPAPEGVTLRGGKRSSVLLFIPDLYFNTDIPMGSSVWLYMGDMMPAYCIYVPWEKDQ